MEAKVDALFGDKAEVPVKVDEWISLDFITHFKPGEYKVAPSSMGATSMTGATRLPSEEEVKEKRERFTEIWNAINKNNPSSAVPPDATLHESHPEKKQHHILMHECNVFTHACMYI